MAVALKGEDVGCEAIKEHAVMADDHGAAGEIFQCFFKRCQCFRIEVIGGFVEQQNIGARL